MAWKPRKNKTKLVNETAETIQLVQVSVSGHRLPEATLAPKGEYTMRRKFSDTGLMLEVYDGNNNFTNIIITSDDLLKNSELKVVTKEPPPPPPNGTAPPPAMYFELVKEPRARTI